jgi:arsenate reductase
MPKHVLILCTGNSCRSIMAEAILNQELGPEIKAYSSGVAPSGHVHPLALRALQEMGVQTAGLHSKRIEELPRQDFDAVVTVCDHAKETCPVFPGAPKQLHISIKDPVAMGMEGFEKVAEDVTERLIPELLEALEL